MSGLLWSRIPDTIKIVTMVLLKHEKGIFSLRGSSTNLSIFVSDEPVITHGLTFTSKIRFRDVVQVIKVRSNVVHNCFFYFCIFLVGVDSEFFIGLKVVMKFHGLDFIGKIFFSLCSCCLESYRRGSDHLGNSIRGCSCFAC